MSVSIAMVRALVVALERQGVDRSLLIAEAGIDRSRLDDANARLTAAEYDRVQHAALRLSGDEALGLHMGEHPNPAAYDVLGHLAEHAATLRQAIETLTRYSRIVTTGPKAELFEEGEKASVRFGFRRAAAPKLRFAAELSLSGLLHMIRVFAGADARPRAVYFTYSAPEYRAEYARIFEGAERFEHAFTGIEFEREWLDRTQLYKSAELYAVLQTQAERALGRIERAATLAARVTEQLASHGLRALPSMAEVARGFGMSSRSLRRRLMAEGVVYKDLVDQISVREAKRMLEDPRVSIQETAYATGFGTPAAFHRAFKRWTGMTPKEYRAAY